MNRRTLLCFHNILKSVSIVDKYNFDDFLELCGLRVSQGDDRDAIVNSVSDLLEWVDSLRVISTDHVKPLINPSQNFISPRKDNASAPLPHLEVLDNAAQKNFNYIVIPKLK